MEKDRKQYCLESDGTTVNKHRTQSDLTVTFFILAILAQFFILSIRIIAINRV